MFLRGQDKGCSEVAEAGCVKVRYLYGKRPQTYDQTDPVHRRDRGPGNPLILRQAGADACLAADEFFSARISNWETRRAYARSVLRFLAWCEDQGLTLARITPGIAGRFIRSLPVSDASKNQALAALRNFFDTLVERHAMRLNPFHSVRGIKYKVEDGKTPQLTIGQARTLVASFDLSRPVGLRDRALFGTMITTGCRVGALARLGVRDLLHGEDGRVFRFQEKNGKQREIPVRSDLDGWLVEYMEAAGLDAGDNSPLWLCAGRWGSLHRKAIGPMGIRALLKRRLAKAGLPPNLTPHSFRVMVVTALLSQNVPVEQVQHLVGHSHPSTTQLYDRRRRSVTRSIVERIPF